MFVYCNKYIVPEFGLHKLIVLGPLGLAYTSLGLYEIASYWCTPFLGIVV